MSSPTQRFDLSELNFREEHVTEPDLVALSMGQLAGEEEVDVRQHLVVCKRCREALKRVHSDDGTGATRVSDPMLGRVLGEYQVEKALARGGMGVVYSGSHPVIGKRVAIKVLIPDLVDPGAIDRLLEEARAVNAIRHPNIIDIFSFGGLPDGRQYFVMELLDGRSLDEILQQDGPLEPEKVVHVLEQVMSALGAAHQAGVIHRDLKPANLFVSTLPDGTWHVTVLDFGLAKRSASSSKTSANLVMGTPGFMAPEQISGKGAVPQTDLYAMGVVAWVLLTGQPPYEGEGVLGLMRAHLSNPVPKLAPLAPRAPAKLVEVIERMLAKEIDDRPASAMEVHATLRDLKSKLITQPIDPMPSSKQPRVLARPKPPTPAPSEVLVVPKSRTPMIVLLSGVVAVLAVAVAFAFSRSPADEKPPEPIATRPTEPVDAKPVDTKPVDTKPVEPVDTTPVDTKPVDTKPVDTKPVDTKPVDTKPVDTKPAVADFPSPRPSPAGAGEGVPRAKPVIPPVPVISGVGKRPLVMLALEQRLAKARVAAGKLSAPAQRRLMNTELDEIEARLKDGERPRRIAKDLDEVLERYAAKP